MSDFYLGEIRLFSYGRNPVEWLPCDGRKLQIQQNSALFSIIGNQFGGDGRIDFALPDLRGRCAVFPQTANLQRIQLNAIGQIAGEETHTLTVAEVPSHSHQAQASKDAGKSNIVAGNVWAAGAAGQNLYDTLPASPVQMNPATVDSSGGGMGHNTMQPFLAVNYCIAVRGLYPPRP